MKVSRVIEKVMHGWKGGAGNEHRRGAPRQPFTRQIRNVEDRLPKKLRSVIAKRMRAAYRAETALAAQAQLQALAGELERTHPSAAASLREGLEETLTVLRLGVPPTLARSLRSTNCVESMIGIARDHSRNVKRWRWCHRCP